jgi:hypothetical protein
MSDADEGRGEEDEAMSLVRLAGARPALPPDVTADARAHVHAAWRAGIRRRRARTALLAAAAGLAVVAAVMVSRRDRRETPRTVQATPPPAVARLAVAAGLVEREAPSGWIALAAGEALPVGSHVRTGAQGAAFAAAEARSLRLAPRSRLKWAAPDRLALEAGAVYVDSGGGAGPASFEVLTSWGAVRETGTQFEVRLEEAFLRVRVREGRVAVLGPGPTLDVTGGTELRVAADGATRRALPIHGAEWSWVMALAPPFEMEGRPLHLLLAWAAREAGWELRYADVESRRRSEAAQLHGSIRGLRPDEAVETVIPSTGLPHRLRDGVLEVGPVATGGDAR